MDRSDAKARGLGGRGASVLLVSLSAAATLINGPAFLSPSGSDSLMRSLDFVLFDPQNTTPELSLCVFLAILFLRREAMAAALGRPAAAVPAAVLLILWLAFTGWGRSVAAPDLERLGFVFGVAGAGFWLGGRTLARRLVLPLCALLLSVPLPAAWVHQILLPLQLGTAWLASVLLDLIGQPHLHLSDQILRGSVLFQVIEGCSGYRSIQSISLAAILYAELVCRRREEKVLLIALSPGVAFAVNGVRVLALILGEIRPESPIHAALGVATLVVAVIVLSLIEAWLFPLIWGRAASTPRRRSPHVVPRRHAGATSAPGSAAWGLRGRLLSLTIGAAAVAVGLMFVPKPFDVVPRPGRLHLAEIATRVEGWKTVYPKRDAQFLGTMKFRHVTLRRFERGEESVTVFLAGEDRSFRHHFGWGPKTAIPGPGWLEIESLSDLEVDGQPIERRIVRYLDRTLLVYHWREGYASWLEEFARDWLALDWTPWRISEASIVVRLETPIAPGDAGLEQADRRLREFAERVHRDHVHEIEREREKTRDQEPSRS